METKDVFKLYNYLTQVEKILGQEILYNTSKYEAVLKCYALGYSPQTTADLI
jgi:hypothetical protein